MFSRVRRIVPAFLILCLAAGPAFADMAKLDARARIALSHLQSGASAEALKGNGAAVSSEGMIDAFVVGQVSRFDLEAAGAIVRTELPGIFTVYIPAAAIEAVAELGGVQKIQGAAPVELELDFSVPTTGANVLRGAGPAFTGYNGANVLVGDVDSGIDFDHGDFKDAGGLTRLVSIWDQTNLAGPGPMPFAYGTEWSAAQINGGLCTQTNTDGHGTHVMGIAAGDGSSTGGAVPAHTYVGMAPMADLCMVKTNFSTTGVVDGVAYVFNRATALGKNAVCNLSLGSHFGPKDGTSAFEAGLSAMTGPGRIIIKSSGNERGQARHAEVLAAGAGTNATMTISGSAVGRLVAIDGYYEATENLNVQITTPNGTVVGPIPVGGISAGFPGTVTANGRVYLENGAALTATGDKQVYIEINVQTGQNMNGTWTFTFIPVVLGAANGEVDLWRFFNSTGTAANFVLGNQNAEELISEPGNAVDLITTGAWTSKRVWTDCNGLNLNFTGSTAINTLAPFSSPGPTRDGRQKPDISAPGTAIASATSFDIAQVCAAGGSLNLGDGLQHTINQGTSMAAPHTAGAAALIMQKYGAVTPNFIKTFLNARAKVDGFTGAVWNKDFGNGKLFLGDMIDPAVTVVAPNGGEVHTLGSIINLDWNATDALGGVTAVDLELSRTGPAGPWETIATGIPNTGSYAWTSTGVPTVLAILRARASDAAGNTGQDDSDQTWTLEAAVPSTMAFYEVESVEGGVEIRWQVGDRDVRGEVRVQRSQLIAGPYETIAVERRTVGDVEIALDRSAEAGLTYHYRLELDGAVFGPITVNTSETFTEFAIGRVAPNPAAAGPVDVQFTVARDSRVSLAVYDLRGRKVADLADSRYAPGRYTARWNSSGVAAGLYFVRMISPAGEKTARVILSN
jgi:subtilisin family serine protease